MDLVRDDDDGQGGGDGIGLTDTGEGLDMHPKVVLHLRGSVWIEG